MNPIKALWEKGDFTRIASSMRTSGEALVGRLGISKGMKVLDLGSGDGTTALPAARLGADVLGVDIAGNLVAAGNRRAQEASLANLRFEEGGTAASGLWRRLLLTDPMTSGGLLVAVPPDRAAGFTGLVRAGLTRLGNEKAGGTDYWCSRLGTLTDRPRTILVRVG